MTAIERTAYPRFRTTISKRELQEIYSPQPNETQFARDMAREDDLRLSLLIQLKCFQRLGYFAPLDAVPSPIIYHIRNSTDFGTGEPVDYEHERTQFRHRDAVRQFLNVRPFREGGQAVAERAATAAAETIGDPADLINAIIEELVRQKIELPAFSHLDRLVKNIRTKANDTVYSLVTSRLSQGDRDLLDKLPELSDRHSRTNFTILKEPSGRNTLRHMRELQGRLIWLQGLIDTSKLLSNVPQSKINFYTQEARAYEPFYIRRLKPPRRYTLLLCLLHSAAGITRDNLAEMFLKRIAAFHKRAQEELEEIRKRQRNITEELIDILSGVLQHAHQAPQPATLGGNVYELFRDRGGIETLIENCESISAYHGNNYFPLLWRFFRSYRSVLYDLVDTLGLQSSTSEQSLIEAYLFVQDHRHTRSEYLFAEELSLKFATPRWLALIENRDDGHLRLHKRHLEVCVFSYLAAELKTGDLFVPGSDSFADYRTQLLSWEECQPLLEEHCVGVGLPAEPKGLVTHLKSWLQNISQEVDAIPSEENGVYFHKGHPRLRRYSRVAIPEDAELLRRELLSRLPERKLLDGLANVQHWVDYTAHFGPASGSDPKIQEASFRYLMTVFSYGCNLGPTQMARHAQGAVSERTLSFLNRQHITTDKLDTAIRDVINFYNRFDLPRYWGTGKHVAADGTQFDLLQDNLLAERHIRYGGYGGIAYHHVSDKYIALFSHFISVGVWEAVYIIDGLLKNHSEIQPDTVHADTQGQSAPVFGLAHLLGIKLMPRIRQWQGLNLYRSDARRKYKNIDSLFSGTIDWKLIETHWEDLMQVTLSIKAGVLMPSTVLRKLGTYSHKNRLYRAFRELGRVVRTGFLLRYISDMSLRRQITAFTNKAEAYHGFSKWLFFGGHGVIAHNDPIEQEKRIKYNDLVANAMILQNVVDMTRVLLQLKEEGYIVTAETLTILSPYLTAHIRRFGDYVLNMERKPEPIEYSLLTA